MGGAIVSNKNLHQLEEKSPSNQAPVGLRTRSLRGGEEETLPHFLQRPQPEAYALLPRLQAQSAS